MTGTVIVGEPDAAGQPGLEPPQEERSGDAASKIESLNERVQSVLDGGGGDGGSGDGGGGGDTHGNETGDGGASHGGNETDHSDDGHD